MAAWTDVREAILEELATLMTGLSGVGSVWRNRGQLEESEGEGLPAIIVLDGREENTMEVPAQKTVVFPAVIMAMRPEIVVQLRPRDTVQNLLLDGQVDPPGPELSSWRQRIMQAIFNDQVIVGNPTSRVYGLLGSGGQINYVGCETDMRIGSPMVGQMMMGFEFRYTLLPP